MTLEAVETRTPKLMVVPQPTVDRTQGFGIQLTNSRRALLFDNYQADGSKHAQVLRNRRATGTKISRYFADGAFAAAQHPQNPPASRIGDRPKYRFALLTS